MALEGGKREETKHRRRITLSAFRVVCKGSSTDSEHTVVLCGRNCFVRTLQEFVFVNCVTFTACMHQILPLKSNSYMVKEVVLF